MFSPVVVGFEVCFWCGCDAGLVALDGWSSFLGGWWLVRLCGSGARVVRVCADGELMAAGDDLVRFVSNLVGSSNITCFDFSVGEGGCCVRLLMGSCFR